jgi:hypothetical protein
MGYNKGKRKEDNKKKIAEENGGIYIPKKRRDPDVTARAVANRKKIGVDSRKRKKGIITEDSDEESDEERGGSAEDEQVPNTGVDATVHGERLTTQRKSYTYLPTGQNPLNRLLHPNAGRHPTSLLHGTPSDPR